jgi:hypothetical protein
MIMVKERTPLWFNGNLGSCLVDEGWFDSIRKERLKAVTFHRTSQKFLNSASPAPSLKTATRQPGAIPSQEKAI